MSDAVGAPRANGPHVVGIAMDEPGHLSTLLPVVAGLVRRGARCVVYAPASARARVEATGARFADVFAGRPLAAADDVSSPFPCRYVSFAGRFGEALLDEVAARAPDLVLYDSFAVVGRAIGHALGLPHVAVSAGHDVRPEVHLARLAHDPRVRLSDACLAGAEVLRRRFGLPRASPFAYVDALSPHLNLCGEPREFVDADARGAFEPAAWFGGLPDPAPLDAGPADGTARPAPTRDGTLRVYASFGTVVARYFRPAVVSTLAAVVAHAATRPEVELTIGLGGLVLDADERARLRGPRVRVETFVDQWARLAATDVFVTHHGVHSTQEAIFHGVPMVAVPFFWDQPALAARCVALGVSVHLGDGPVGAVSADDVGRALDEVRHRRDAMAAALARTRAWTRAALADRPAILQRVLDLASTRRP